VAGVLVIDIADEIRIRLGEPTLSALTRRFGTEGRCLTCGEQLGTAPLSVRAYRDLDGITTVVAYHADCAGSAWIDMGHGDLPCYQTWEAAAGNAALPVSQPRWRHPLSRPPVDEQLIPAIFVRPSLEMTRVRQVGLGEAVNADLEIYCSLGFSSSRTLPCSRHFAGQAWAAHAGETAALHVLIAGRSWSAPASDAVLSLAAAHGSAVAGITFEYDPSRLAADDECLRDAIASGDILLGWISLRGRPGNSTR
jgi:hypothetical protein